MKPHYSALAYIVYSRNTVLTIQDLSKTGPVDVSVCHWQWAFSNLASNALRGVLAEYIVADAFGGAPVDPSDPVMLPLLNAIFKDCSAYERTSRRAGPALSSRARPATAPAL
jgi:hypothetical protein